MKIKKLCMIICIMGLVLVFFGIIGIRFMCFGALVCKSLVVIGIILMVAGALMEKNKKLSK